MPGLARFIQYIPPELFTMLPSLSVLLASIAVLVTSSSAQQAHIQSPQSGFQVSASQSFTVEVETPPFLSSSEEVSVVLGYKPCGTMLCLSPSETGIGEVLYKGDYNPQRGTGLNVQQNFTVTIPTWASPGPAMLSLVHYALIGAVNIPWMESKAINLTVV
ncbi:hypothetical protein E1B28_011964 [Marasmius oreades]|uniref:Uncharacterized protein n=1 Tax=Marasmius oreades TaxID=181124 RepID=A0A9P7UPF3_9AGAR|nr:uncharacterized protein E1B28_011964 [Marasmius oreades]KAG7087916.1 hypothetical protein E1B28_011964 [Marasmius oreades]